MHDEKASAGSGDLSGTPLYMSPEAIQLPGSVDARSDLYAVGAVGYFLLTGQPVFSAQTLGRALPAAHPRRPTPPRSASAAPVPPELEHAILACLEKSRAKRPQTARDLARDARPRDAGWSLDDADAWWSRHERTQPAAGGTGGPLTGSESSRTSHSPQNATPSERSASTKTSGTVTPGFDRTTIFQPGEADK